MERFLFEAVSKFENPILVGNSLSGYYPSEPDWGRSLMFCVSLYRLLSIRKPIESNDFFTRIQYHDSKQFKKKSAKGLSFG